MFRKNVPVLSVSMNLAGESLSSEGQLPTRRHIEDDGTLRTKFCVNPKLCLFLNQTNQYLQKT
jgi:hypothetical protein